MATKVTWTDKGWDSIRERLTKGPAKTHARVGVLGAVADMPHKNSNDTIGNVALHNEFGSDDGHVPPRPFIRNSIMWNNRAYIKRLLAQVSVKVTFQKVSRFVAMADVGRAAVELVKKTILAGVQPANAQATIDKKGHGDTLIEDGQLYDSISYVIETGQSDDD